MTKENIELLKDLLQAILPTLIFIFFVVLFFLYRKKIEMFSSKITKIKGKIAGQEFETEIKESIIETTVGTSDKVTGQNLLTENKPTDDTVEDSVIKTVHHLWFEYDKNDIKRTKEAFEEIQSKETDPEKRIHNEIFYFYIKALNGDIDAKSQLEEFAKGIKYDDEKFEAYEFIGRISRYSRNYERAISEFNFALNLALNETQKSDIINHISECYYELGEIEKAEDVIWEFFKTLKEDKAICACLKNLAELYGKQKKQFLRALVLEKAIEYEPNNVDLLFDLAYSYSESNLNALAILHYKTLLSFDSEANYAHNNLGVAYQFFNLPFKGNKEYKTALDQKNTLAAGNLASNLVAGGFYEEAKRIIDEVKKNSNYNTKIDEASESLNNAFKNEEEKEKEILESAKKQERFFKRLAGKNFSQSNLIDLSGEWMIDGEIICLNASVSLHALDLKWLVGQSKFELSGSFLNAASLDIKYSDLKPGFTTLYRNSKGYGLFNEKLVEIQILILIENSHEVKELSLKKVLL